MDYMIVLQKNWRWRRDQMMTPGTYRVPEDMSEAMAEQALKGEGAVRVGAPAVEPPKAQPKEVADSEPKDDASEEPDAVEESEEQDKPKRKRGRPPKSKARGVAPENKTALD